MSKSNKIREKLGLGPLKKPLFGNNRSHALNATRKMSKPNIQSRWVELDGEKVKVKLTAWDIRTLDKKGLNLG